VCSRGTNRPNQSMKPTAPLRNKLTHSLALVRPSAFPSMSLRFPRAPFSVFTNGTLDFIQVPGFPGAIRVFALTHSAVMLFKR